MAAKVNQVHKINIKTISPVSIGDGKSKSPLGDYFTDNGRLFYINKSKFEDYLGQHPEVLESYINKVQKGTLRAKNDFLKNFIIHEMNANVTDFCVNEGHPIFGSANATEVFSILKNGDRPYIAGSTVKGAIKTAILYDWLINDSIGKTALEAFKRDVLAGKWWRELDFAYNKKIEWPVFGKIGRNRMEYSLFKVRDSIPVSNADLGVFHAGRQHLVGKGVEDNAHIPFLKEGILPGVQTAFEILIADNKLEQIRDFRLKKIANNIGELFRIVNQFTEDNLERELRFVHDKIWKEAQENLSPFFDFLEKRQEAAANIPTGSNRAFMRLGSGKNYFYNAMSLALFNRYQEKNPEVIVQFRKTYKLGQRKKSHPEAYWRGLFPRTRTILDGFSEFGWIEIKKID